MQELLMGCSHNLPSSLRIMQSSWGLAIKLSFLEASTMSLFRNHFGDEGFFPIQTNTTDLILAEDHGRAGPDVKSKQIAVPSPPFLARGERRRLCTAFNRVPWEHIVVFRAPQRTPCCRVSSRGGTRRRAPGTVPGGRGASGARGGGANAGIGASGAGETAPRQGGGTGGGRRQEESPPSGESSEKKSRSKPHS